MRGSVATVERVARGRVALPGPVVARRSAKPAPTAAESSGEAIAGQASTERGWLATWRPAEQLEFLFGEVVPRRRSGLQLVSRAAVVAPAPATDAQLEAPDCGCLLIEEHLDRCILRRARA